MTYVWRCSTCGKEVEVQRPSKDIEVEPTKEEAGGEHSGWIRVLAPTPFVRGAGWRGSKGSW